MIHGSQKAKRREITPTIVTHLCQKDVVSLNHIGPFMSINIEAFLGFLTPISKFEQPLSCCGLRDVASLHAHDIEGWQDYVIHMHDE